MRSAEHLSQPSGTHFVFDFAEKVVLPHLLRQPGQLHFATGLKADFFGVHCRKLKRTMVFCLLEGHWPNGMTSIEVASMFYHSV